MEKRVFISYRRSDSGWAANAVYKALRAQLSKNQSSCRFRWGDFVEYLMVGSVNATLVMIGPRTNADGRRRLDNENDFVRIEIRQALGKIPVVPVLLDNTPMPAANACRPTYAR